MGEVYLAQDQTLERNVALKVLPNDVTRSEDRVRRFVQEAKSASSLNHPNIVTIYEIGQDPVRSSSGSPDSGPLHYISMELISGKTLGAKIHEEKTDLRTLCGYLAQAAEGIAKAHAAGIVHRDLKPGNIMVSDDGFAKVLDFGLAKLTEKSGMSGPNEATEISGRTVEGTVMGTVHYMSPEQVQGKTVDARSDIFSFGCLLYEAATRVRPFTADSNVETMHKILHEKPQPIEDINPAAPAELRRLIRRCLAKTPDQRAQSMKDIAIELREIVEEYDALSASATSASGVTAAMPAARAAAPKKRSPMVPILIGVSVVAAAAVAFGLWGLKRGGDDSALQSFQNMRITTTTNRGDVNACAISRDGRFLAYVAGRGGQVTLRVRQIATGSDVEILPVQQGPIEFPVFTPDGNYLFYCKRKPGAQLYRSLTSIPSLGGQEQERAFDVDSPVTFSPDGKRACYVRGVPQEQRTAIVILNLDTREEKELASIGMPGGPGAPAWSPDGKFIAMPLIMPPPNGSTTIALFNPENGERRDFFKRDATFMEDVAWTPDGKGLIMSGFMLGTTLSNQVFRLTYPGGQLVRVTNDINNYFNVSAGAGEDAIATLRASQLSNLYVVDAGGAAPPRALTNATSAEHAPFGLTTDGDNVYYTSLRGDFNGLFSIPLAGGEPAVIESGKGFVGRVAAGGGVVLFDRIDTDQRRSVWRVQAGAPPRAMTRGGKEGLLDISPDGSLFTYVTSDSTRGVWIASTETGEARMLSPTALTQVAVFSYDGRFVVCIELKTDAAGLIQNEYRVLDAATGELSATLTPPQTALDYRGVPGMRGASYIERSDPAGNLFMMDAIEGSKPKKITKFTDLRVTGHNWTTDGKRLLITRRAPDGSENLWVMNADGSGLKQLTTFTGQEIFQAAWTTDNKNIVLNVGVGTTDVALIKNFR